MSVAEYQQFNASDNIPWFCAQCVLPDFTDSFFEDETEHVNCAQHHESDSSSEQTLPLITKKGLKIAYLNINSVVSHHEELVALTENQPLDILCLTETKLSSCIEDAEISLPGFTVAARKDRNRRGGRVMCYVREGLQCKHRRGLDPRDLECVWTEIKPTKQTKILVGTLYRPPGTPTQEFYDKFDNNLAQVSAGGNDVYLVGDMNINLLDGGNEQLLHIASDHGLTQLISSPTRITGTSSTLIDLIFTILNLCF